MSRKLVGKDIEAITEDLTVIVDRRISTQWDPVPRVSGDLLQHRWHVHSLGVLDDLVLGGVAHLQMSALILIVGEIGSSHLEDEYFFLISSHPRVRANADLLTTVSISHSSEIFRSSLAPSVTREWDVHMERRFRLMKYHDMYRGDAHRALRLSTTIRRVEPPAFI